MLKKILALLLGVRSEKLVEIGKKWVVKLETTRKEYELNKEKIKQTSDEVKAAKEKQKEGNE